MWELVSGLLKDPERLRVGLEEMIEQERRGYLRLAAKGRLSNEELDEALAELEDTRITAERELGVIRGRKEALEELERDRDALLESYAEMTLDALDALMPEERRDVYRMLRLTVEVDLHGNMEARGVLGENVRVLYENGRPVGEAGLCENGIASPC